MEKFITLLVVLLTTTTSFAQCFKNTFAGPEHFIAISQDGTLWAWGKNNGGQLGDGTTTYRDMPVQISSETGWLEASASATHNVAVKEDGTLWAWGNNSYGQLGNGTQGGIVLYPTQIGTDTDWKQASAGDYYGSVAVKTDGTLWTWGTNQNGYLGNGMSQNYKNLIPTQLGTEMDWASVSGKHYHCLALKSDGTLWSWGYNFSGQLGLGTDGSGTDIYIPTQVGTASNWKWINSSRNFSYALKDNDSLWAWGYAGSYLGIDTAQPVQVGAHTDWKSVVVHTENSAALLVKQNGTLWAWGYDGYERLGNGPTTGHYQSPTQIGAATDWETATIGYYESNAVKSDGTFWAWGRTGLVGNSTGDIPSPMQYDCTPLMSVADVKVKSLEVYPNPAKDVVHFSKAIDGELFDTTGKKVMTIKNAKSVNVAGLAKGVYVLVTTEGATAKIIIK